LNKIKIEVKFLYLLLIIIAIPLVNADPIVINENGQQSATINIQPYQIGNNNYADILIQGINDYFGDEIFIKKLSYPLQILQGDIGLGRYSEILLEPFICIEGDLECELEKQNREQITISSDTDLFAFPNLEIDYATLKLKKYKDIDNIVSCYDFDVNTFECNSKFEEENVNFISDNSFIYFNLTHFSGWSGIYYHYADMEEPGLNLCQTNGDNYKGSCDDSNQVITNYTDRVFMDNESMNVFIYPGSNRAYGYVPLEGIAANRHYSRIYMYVSKEDLNGLTQDSPLFSAMDESGNTTSCGFMFKNNSKEEISCFYDDTPASYNPTEFGNTINMTQWDLWNKWITLEYFIDTTADQVNICSCWVNGTLIGSTNSMNYNLGAARFAIVGYSVSKDNGRINLTFDEHRISDHYIGGYPAIIATYVKYNIISPLTDQTIYTNITDNEGANDINFVYLTFNNTLNITMYRLGSSSTWSVNISSSNFTAGNNYTYTVYANDSNGQNAVPFTSSFLTNYNDIIFNSSFESGNLKTVTYKGGDISGKRYYDINISYNDISTGGIYNTYHWWFYFKVSNTANKNLYINITNPEPDDFSENRWPNLRPRYSYDYNPNTIYSNWSLVPYYTVNYGNHNNPWFRWNLTITQDYAYFASTPVYTVSMLNEFINEIKDSSFINYTNLTVSPHGRNVTIIDVSNFTDNNLHKHRIYIIAQQHACEEPQGSWASMGAIRFLINTTNETAISMRQNYIFRFMPILNVDGVYEGVGRLTPVYTEGQYDPNREWNNAEQQYSWVYQIVNKTYLDIVGTFNSNIFLDWHGSLNGESFVNPFYNYYLLERGYPYNPPLPETQNFLQNYITPAWGGYVYGDYIHQSNPESAPPNVYTGSGLRVTPAATFEWTINNYTSTIVANNTIWLEDGKKMMLGIYNYFESS